MIDRTKAAGWAAFEVLTEAQANQLDVGHTAMADGRHVPDYFWAINWTPEFGVDVRIGVYSAFHKKWVMVGGAAGAPTNYSTFDFRLFTAGGAIAGGASWQASDMAASSSGLVVAVGGGGTTTDKARWTNDAGATWNTATTFQNDNIVLSSVIYHEQSGHFVATSSTNTVPTIYTSPDAVTWTLQTVDPAWTTGIGGLATDGKVIVALSDDSTGQPVTKYLRTENPLVWTSAKRDLPLALRQAGIAYTDFAKQFVIASINENKSLRSGNGTDWVLASGVSGTRPAAYRNLIMTTGQSAIAGQVWFSADNGGSWHCILDKPTGNNYTRVRYGGGRFVAFANNTGTASRATRGSIFDG